MLFRLWQCPRCSTIRAVDGVDYQDIYADYPLQKRELDVFARNTFRNLLRRLRQVGLRSSDTILDYGCGNGLFVRYLQAQGYAHVTGYDPYDPAYCQQPSESQRYDCVFSNDVIEHCDDPRGFIRACAARVRPGGLLYLGTSEPNGIQMADLTPHLMRLHLPYHRTIFTQETLHALVACPELELVRSWRRSYMDTWLPFGNYRFLDEVNKALDHNLDRCFNPSETRWLWLRPRLWFYGLFGYWFPSAYEPAVALRKQGTAQAPARSWNTSPVSSATDDLCGHGPSTHPDARNRVEVQGAIDD
ncbi:MAG: class I SAM-dependent methyltransferase [Gemmataceae bacterium]